MYDYKPSFEPVDFVVEATDTERFFLWRFNDERKDGRKVSWKEIPSGLMVVFGEFAGFPVSVSLTWAFVNGRKVCFYADESRVVDHDMVKKFVRDYVASASARFSNASNFHNTLIDIKLANEAGQPENCKRYTQRQIDNMSQEELNANLAALGVNSNEI
jgi:hypothetical protein